jgi:hypothetical protein
MFVILMLFFWVAEALNCLQLRLVVMVSSSLIVGMMFMGEDKIIINLAFLAYLIACFMCVLEFFLRRFLVKVIFKKRQKCENH